LYQRFERFMGCVQRGVCVREMERVDKVRERDVMRSLLVVSCARRRRM